MDDDYSYTSFSDTQSTSSVTTDQDMPYLLDDLSENDISDIIIDIYEQFGDFLKNNVLMISSPTFYKTMFKFIF